MTDDLEYGVYITALKKAAIVMNALAMQMKDESTRNLIAATPGLHEALEAIVAVNVEWSNDIHAKAEAAIKKARKL